jgi:uncharacterized SAM-binding protein YcdF (DUF218 family)
MRLGRISIFVFVFALFLAGFFYYKQSRIILQQKVNSWTDHQVADCGIVLTGGPGRVREGFDLLAQGRIKKLIISGVYPQAEIEDIFLQLPFYGPISDDQVILEKRSTTTYGNAQQSLPLVEILKCRGVILVTSRLHMHRSQKIFRRVLPEGIQLYPRAIIAGRYEPTFVELFIETTKSLFYSLWAY